MEHREDDKECDQASQHEIVTTTKKRSNVPADLLKVCNMKHSLSNFDTL